MLESRETGDIHFNKAFSAPCIPCTIVSTCDPCKDCSEAITSFVRVLSLHCSQFGRSRLKCTGAANGGIAQDGSVPGRDT